MATDPVAGDDIDDETLAAFEKVAKAFKSKNPEGFKEWLKDLLPSSPPVSDQKTTPATDLTTFLQTELDLSRKAANKLREEMDLVRDILTPEQLTSLRSLRNAPKSGEGNPGQEKGNNGPPKGEQHTKPQNKRKWL